MEATRDGHSSVTLMVTHSVTLSRSTVRLANESKAPGLMGNEGATRTQKGIVATHLIYEYHSENN